MIILKHVIAHDGKRSPQSSFPHFSARFHSALFTLLVADYVVAGMKIAAT